MNKQEQRIIDAARKVLSNWIDGGINADVSGDFNELEFAFNSYNNPSAMDFDWQSFRAEAAKDILAGILAHANICISETDKTRLTKLALSYTEELIRQLKEKEEK